MEIQQQVLVISQFSLSLIQAWCIRLIWVTYSYLWVVCGTSQICMSLFFKQTFTCELALVCGGTFFAPTSQAAMWQQDVRLSWLALKFTCDNSCCVGVLLCQKSDLWALYSEGFSTSMHRSWAEQHWSLSPRLQFQAALSAMPACLHWSEWHVLVSVPLLIMLPSCTSKSLNWANEQYSSLFNKTPNQ